jgi:hypothetical protein
VLPRKKDCTESSWPVKWPCARRHCQGTVSRWPGHCVQPSVNSVCFLSKLCILNLEISFSVLQIARGRWMLVALSLGSLLPVFVSSQPSKSRKTCRSFFWMPVLCWIPQELFGICSWLGSHTNCMARFGLLAGVATAALGALCSYEARVLHLHSVVPGDTFQVWILPCVMFVVSRVFYFGFITPHQKSLLCPPEFYSFSMNTVPGMLRKIFTIWFGLVFGSLPRFLVAMMPAPARSARRSRRWVQRRELARGHLSWDSGTTDSTPTRHWSSHQDTEHGLLVVT